MMNPDPELYPYGYKAEQPLSHPTFRKRVEQGWAVYRQYVLYDDRPAIELLAVHPTEEAAAEHEANISVKLAAKSVEART